MRGLTKADADKWLQDPDNLANRFKGNMHLTREDALRLHAERFGKSSEGDSSSTPEGAAAPDPSTEKGAPSEDVVREENGEIIVPENVEVVAPENRKLTDAERAEAAVLALQIGPTKAAEMMAISATHAARLRDGERGNDFVKDMVEETLAKARSKASQKLLETVDKIEAPSDPVKATQVAVGLATVVEKIENRGKAQNKGVAVVYRTIGRQSSEYEEVELRMGA